MMPRDPYVVYVWPGNAWLVVRLAELIRRGIAGKVGLTSKIDHSGEWVYLNFVPDAAALFGSFFAERGCFPRLVVSIARGPKEILSLRPYMLSIPLSDDKLAKISAESDKILALVALAALDTTENFALLRRSFGFSKRRVKGGVK